jgi:hypothetical protein
VIEEDRLTPTLLSADLDNDDGPTVMDVGDLADVLLLVTDNFWHDDPLITFGNSEPVLLLPVHPNCGAAGRMLLADCVSVEKVVKNVFLTWSNGDGP